MADRNFLNFRISDELRDLLDDAAKKSGWDRSKQARAMLMAAFGVEERKPYIPVPEHRSEQLGFGGPAHDVPGRKSKSLRKKKNTRSV